MVEGGPKSLWETEAKPTLMARLEGPNNLDCTQVILLEYKGRMRSSRTKKEPEDDLVSFHASLHHLAFLKPSLSFRISASEDAPLQQMKNIIFRVPLSILHSNNQNN